MQYDTVIFDLDGTLLNTLDDLYLSVNYALKKFNYPLRTKEEIRSFLGNGVRVLINESLPNDKTKLEEVIKEFKNYYQSHSTLHISKYNGIDELLDELDKLKIKYAVVTNKFDLAAKEIILKFFGNRFEIVIGEDPKLNKKPHPDMCNKALKLLNSNASNTIYVGDSEVDMHTAKNIGALSVICSWGFRTKEELINSGAVNIVEHPMEIINFLKK